MDAMTGMVERVARAILASWYGGNLQKDQIEEHMDMARAAIEAMREPTEAMLENAGTIRGYDDDYYNSADKNHIAWWQDMVTAALEAE